jgi:hypothetical protein
VRTAETGGGLPWFPWLALDPTGDSLAQHRRIPHAIEPQA